MTPVAFKFPQKRSQLLGGLEDVDVDRDDVQQAAEFAVQEYNNANSDLHFSRLVRVVHASEQVVAGLNYYLDVEIARTTCVKSQSEQADCAFSENPMQHCSFVAYSMPWENYMALTSSSCRSA
ncbi:cystatin-C-like isoform X1 [Heterocephalus glaber]|uniref:Cystatin-C-like isoform X1 n=1 Tax=Heterocephalus glaber TaxID=10181 RepID=A0AAX6QI87_HETGA|nr:cystatin-C-like isoform X1 [Heterocephalus glaber]XP_021107832.1 cystatin-C-like isoform X1 [Heterocephalus glaber]